MHVDDLPEALLLQWIRRECGQILGMVWPDEATLETAAEWEDEPHGQRVWGLLMRAERNPRLESSIFVDNLPPAEQTAAIGRWLSMLDEHRAIEAEGLREADAEWAAEMQRGVK